MCNYISGQWAIKVDLGNCNQKGTLGEKNKPNIDCVTLTDYYLQSPFFLAIHVRNVLILPTVSIFMFTIIASHLY